MKNLRLFLLATIATLLGAAANSQQGTWKLNLNWGAAFPTGNHKTMFNDPSYRGWSGARLSVLGSISREPTTVTVTP